jgi:hypothetical protein
MILVSCVWREDGVCDWPLFKGISSRNLACQNAVTIDRQYSTFHTTGAYLFTKKIVGAFSSRLNYIFKKRCGISQSLSSSLVVSQILSSYTPAIGYVYVTRSRFNDEYFCAILLFTTSSREAVLRVQRKNYWNPLRDCEDINKICSVDVSCLRGSCREQHKIGMRRV